MTASCSNLYSLAFKCIVLKRQREGQCLVLICLGGFGVFCFFFFVKELFFHIEPEVGGMCSGMKGKIFIINIVYFPYFDVSNGKTIASLKSLGFKIFLNLRSDKILTYKPHILPTYILMFILITDIRVSANNTFPDGCHFKIKQKYRS